MTILESVDAPEKMGYNGGIVTLKLKIDTQTKSEPEFLPWKYQVLFDETEFIKATVEKPVTELTIEIPGNYNLDERTVAVRMTDCTKETEEWSTVASFKQEAAVIKMEYEGDFDTFWAKGNIDIKDGRFIVAEKYSDVGLLFSADSRYGVKAENYSGTAYAPEAVAITLSEIETKEPADPCKLVSETFRTPSYADFYFLENINYEDPYFDWVDTRDGIKGIHFKDSEFFLPFSGVVSKNTGDYSFKGLNAGYWFLGASAEEDHCIYVISEDYTALYYDLTHENLGSVRCVLDRKLPTYASHSFDKELTDKQMFMTVKVDMGDYPLAEVLAECVESGEVYDASATRTTDAVVNISANTTKQEREWRIFVNRIYSGVSFKQPAMTSYAVYVSHTPASSDYNSFTLSVTIDTDLDNVPVVIKGAGSDLTQTASKTNTTVSFTIPENTATSERTLSIWVDGKDTKKTVKQGAAPAGGLSVEWSSGALTVKNGAYVFAEPTERGMLFKYKSQYGILVEGDYTSSSKYPGYAYGPEKTTVAYEDIKTDQTDPCSLVAPAGTWRLPTIDELNEIKAAPNGKSFSASEYNTKLDGLKEIFFVGGGQMKDDGNGITLPTASSNWSSTESADKPGQYGYMAWTLSSATGSFLVSSAGAKQTKALQVRCVRSK